MTELSDVSRTAVGVARLRALETNRPDRLFADPYASAFVPEGTPDNRAGTSVFRLHIVIRTRFYDDYLLAATAAGCRQVVLVAAGLDTRAFRLSWPAGLRLYELDLPALLAYKEKVLTAEGATPSVARTVVPVDLREDWPGALRAAGFDPTVPTAWLVEGLLVYLTAEDAAKLLTSVTDLSAPGSQVACEHRDADGQHSPGRMAKATPDLAPLTAMWKGGIPTFDWLAGHGWKVESHNGNTLAAGYGRDTDGPTGNFVIGTRA
ncbi:SAM-dependent methyltransferase [Actinocrispum wychmicini]|uniref:S-adenosyl-L-methionine-dependent methyltransferase n=1 Tax=Actinocrispum wychmicini TaxID=1213861 RepID=A0A4V2S694_9PSEU|nr:SAM-dependent methyltransferase [Actinocrispum wychmicini]TCO55070.1 methyltransferase (TIGR00027 family) [Actinocrispum wychmicini]